MRRLAGSAVLLLLALLVAPGCGSSPAAPDSATITLDLQFPPDSSGASPPVARIHIDILHAVTGSVLVTHDLSVLPGVRGRMVALNIKESIDNPLVLEVKLVSEDGRTLWIGRSEMLELKRGDKPRPPIVFIRATPAG